ncbi:UbiA prenyltransferase family protein [Candidatus Woesearchaeota archaeon]|jgi:4-hydroxybenzoate polyprenyltransferase|nr:UbiA prenyltransferase family protein [Candidatus Woesearchaeota archaeon]MBT5397218.1 UbiA prenyltransferase family protein [Candidatus Woesearchaeota archaeon]MBT5924425.1 UbiA prenyltransferase family protein [Candidatus Woesearchaeota archaeon]MBT6367236.1 UbiA prenyltransferase family protein [Candidatus Woesearchaeota archaeon]MBT7762618.1 UbiA prenyltransferase family protein [Candidatus Woesearchaeota archaeon]
MVLKEYISLMRVRQWYKNLLVFLALIFVGSAAQPGWFYLTCLGFISLSCMSSVGYIINDIVDLNADRAHPEKRSRPLASGKIKKGGAIILMLILFTISLYLAQYLGINFLYAVISLFVLTQFYSFFFKRIVFADILVIAILFVIRAVSGVYIINVEISMWLILCPFFLSLFLSTGKRRSNLVLLKEKAAETKKVLQYYTVELTDSLILISTTLFIISYTLYCFLSDHNHLIYTLPFALYVIFRYFYLIKSGSIIARHPEKIRKDIPIVLGILLWIISVIVILYI